MRIWGNSNYRNRVFFYASINVLIELELNQVRYVFYFKMYLLAEFSMKFACKVVELSWNLLVFEIGNASLFVKCIIRGFIILEEMVKNFPTVIKTWIRIFLSIFLYISTLMVATFEHKVNHGLHVLRTKILILL